MTRSMRHAFIIFATQLRRIVVDRSSALFLVAMPLVIIGMLGMTLQPLMASDFKPARPIKVAVAETGNFQSIASVFESLPEVLAVQLFPDETTVRHRALERAVDAAVIVPDAFPDEPITLIAAPGSMAANVVEGIILHAMEGPSAEALQPSGLPAWLSTDSFGYYAVAVTAMFAMLAAHTAMVTSARDRVSDAYARIRSLGVTHSAYMAAGALTSFVVGALLIATLTAATALLFDVGWGPLGSWSLLTLAGAAAIAGLSLTVTALIPHADHVEGVGNAVFQVLAFLGGSMAPLHAMPEWFRSSLAWLPNRAVLTGYLKLAQGADLAAISFELSSLCAAAAVLFALSWAMLSLRMKKEGHR